MKRMFLVTAALVAAVTILTFATLPAGRLRLPPQDDGTVPGVIHIHSNRSDGRGRPDEIAAAAARAGLKFIVFTDHGDATRLPDPPVYRSGVLCIDAVEISTSGGHYIALDMPAAPYPLAGEPRDVVEDVARLGGFGVPAHPDSPKPELRWRDWTAPFDGMEIINPDSGWRARVEDSGWRPKMRLLERLFSYPFRPGETIASFVVASPDNFAQWERLTRQRKVVAIAGADAHSKLAIKSSEPGSSRFALPVPSYEASFETLSVRVRPAAPLTSSLSSIAIPGDAALDAAAVLRGIRDGHLHIVVDGIASPPSFAFTAEGRGKTAGEGDEIAAGGPITLHVRSNAPSAFTTTVWEGSRIIETSQRPEFTVNAPGAPAVYRAEIRASDRPGQPIWLISNPIYVRGAAQYPATVPDRGPHIETTSLDSLRWRVERDPASIASVDVVPTKGVTVLHLQYKLTAARSPQTYAALLTEIPEGVGTATRVGFTARADRPMRVSVQLRTGIGGMPEERWQRSVYIDAANRDHVISFDDLTSIGESRTERPVLHEIRYVLFVVDTTNATPGAAGQVWISRPVLSR